MLERFVGRQLGFIDGHVLNIDIGWLSWVPHHAELAMRHNVGAGLVAQPASTTKVIGMAMGDNHGVHGAQWEAGCFEPCLEHNV